MIPASPTFEQIMLNVFGHPLHRRAVLRVGALGLGGLTLADLLRAEDRAGSDTTATKSVIMVYLPGGPSHIDLYDMKPDAPVEIRGEFKHIKTNVPGLDVCELMPLQAKIADTFSVVRGFHPGGIHDSQMLTTGFRVGTHRPAFGSVVSRLRPNTGTGLPPYVTLVQETNLPFGQNPAYLGPAHKPLAMRNGSLADLTLPRGVTLDRLDDRKTLLQSFDTMRRAAHARGEGDGADAFTARALEMVSSSRTREAFDLAREPEKVRARYGPLPGTQQFLLARRLVEAGVRVVTLCGGWVNDGRGDSPSNLSNWDTHEDNFNRIRMQAPRLDHALYTLLTDLRQRGLDKDVVVVACGEMGRAPRVGKPNDGGNANASGRDHWETGFAWVAGGGLQTGQVIGATDRDGGRSKGRPYTPQNLLATLYRVLEIDPVTTLADHNGRPQYLLDDREPIAELL
jgi:hypothetical protein